jgi:putative flippase GtrA
MSQKLIRKTSEIVATRKGIRYLIAGSASEAVEYFSFLILLAITNLLYFSNSLSFIFGVISGFIIHKTWTFKGEHQFKTRHQFIAYVSLAGVNFVMINIFIGLYVHGLHIAPYIAKFLAIITTLIWTFTLTNLVIFRLKSDQLSKD